MPENNKGKYRINLEKVDLNRTTKEVNDARVELNSNVFKKNAIIDVKEYNRQKNKPILLALWLVLFIAVLIMVFGDKRENNNPEENVNISTIVNDTSDFSEKGDFAGKPDDGIVRNFNGAIEVSNLMISKSITSFYSLLGTVENKSTDTMYSSVYIKIRFYDENGNMLNAERCLAVDYNGIMPNETLQFSTSMKVTGNVAYYEAEIIEDYSSTIVSTSEEEIDVTLYRPIRQDETGFLAVYDYSYYDKVTGEKFTKPVQLEILPTFNDATNTYEGKLGILLDDAEIIKPYVITLSEIVRLNTRVEL